MFAPTEITLEYTVQYTIIVRNLQVQQGAGSATSLTDTGSRSAHQHTSADGGGQEI